MDRVGVGATTSASLASRYYLSRATPDRNVTFGNNIPIVHVNASDD